MKITKELRAKGPAGDMARLRQSLTEAAAVLDKTANIIRKGEVTKELVTELKRGARLMRTLVTLTRPR